LFPWDPKQQLFTGNKGNLMRFLYIGLISVLLFSCVPIPEPMTETPTTTAPGLTETPTATPTSLTPPATTDTPSPSGDPILVGAGDIAGCESEGDELTASLLDNIPGTVFTTGDNAYVNGTASEFMECYDPSWGRHKARTYPSAGNHDYNTEGAAGYFGYFGPVAGEPGKGYYSYDLGSWHIIVLNSNIRVGAGSEQEQWLRADLAAHPVACTLAYWHHPRFSSGQHHGSIVRMQPLWQALYEHGADVVLAGHEHNYERFAPQDPQGTADPVRGIRQFVIGSGGRSFYPLTSSIANSEVQNDDTYGVLKLTLHAESYSWEFVPEPGNTFSDSGTAPCVTGESSASSDILIFTPKDDATIKSNSPDLNFGAASELQADNNPYDNFLMKFEVSGVNDRPVLSAKLRLHNVNESDKGGDLYYVADNSWTENNVTWNTAPLAGSTILASLGSVTKNTWYELDLSSLVISDGTYTIRVSTASPNGADYASKEGQAGLAPQLIVSVGESGAP
jgi:hypothetical protein